jgi:hypothetical protein
MRMLPVGIGMGVFQSPNNSAVMGTVSRERLGIASGLLSINRTLGQTTGIALLGTLWAGRVMIYSSTPPSGGATTAAAGAQIAGLHDTFLTVVGLIALGLVLSIWGLMEERRLRPLAAKR